MEYSDFAKIFPSENYKEHLKKNYFKSKLDIGFYHKVENRMRA